MKHYKRKKKMHLKQAVSFALAAMLALETPITSVSATEITPQEAQKESAEVSTAEISQEQQSNEMAAIAETGTNLIKNGGFETSSGKEFKINPGDISKADLPINDWTYYTTTNTSYRLEKEENGYIEIDDNEKKEGNQSIHFKAIDNTGAAYNKIFGIIANNNSLTKDKYYKYSMWIKTANMKPGQGWKKGFFWKFKHNNGKDYLCNLTSTDLPENEGFDIKDGNAIHENTDGWVYYEVILPKSVGSTLETTLIMEMVTGDVWVDDVRLEEVDCTLNTSVLTLDLENNTSAELNVLEKCGITAEQAKTAEWSADNTDVVELSEKNETGAVTVTALKSGSAIVTATLSDGKTATCIVTVEGEAEPDIPTETEHNLVLSANELSLEKNEEGTISLAKEDTVNEWAKDKSVTWKVSDSTKATIAVGDEEFSDTVTNADFSSEVKVKALEKTEEPITITAEIADDDKTVTAECKLTVTETESNPEIPPIQRKNLITNGDFETAGGSAYPNGVPTATWVIDGYKGTIDNSNITIDKNIVYEGENSLHINSKDKEKLRLCIKNVIKGTFSAGKKYRISMRVNAQNMDYYKWNGFYCRATYPDKTTKDLLPGYKTNTNGWELYENTIEIPKTGNDLTIQLWFDYTAGDVYVDDICVEEIEEIHFKDDTLLLKEEEQKTLEIADADKNKIDGKTLTWESSDESVATVDENGNVTAVHAGNAVITAHTENFYASCDVTVDFKDDLSDFERSVRQYEKFDYSDPQAVTDEEFFGKWNGSSWEKNPLLDYDKTVYDGLSLKKVEEAAKAGDYAKAKEEVLAYYREVFATKHTRNIEGKSSPRNLLTAQVYFENMIDPNITDGGMEKAVARFTVGKEATKVEADVLTELKKAQSGLNKTASYMMMALKKDGYMAVFDSKESDTAENRPYIEAIVNGETVRFDCTADTMISPSGNKDKNYGTEKELKVEESFSSIGNVKTVDSYTKRSYVTFDLSSLNADDEITEATLHMTGKFTESDNPKKSSAVKETKDVILWVSTAAAWEENNFTWAKCSDHAVFSYDGEMGPVFEKTATSGETNVIPSYVDNLSKYGYLHAVAKAYKGAKENQDEDAEVYAYHAIRYLMNSIIKFATKDPKNKQYIADYDNANTYHNTGQRAKVLPEVVDLVIDSKYMTPEIFTAVLKNVFLLNNGLMWGWGSSQEGNNIGTLQIEGLCKCATGFREFKRYSDPLENNGEPEHSEYPGSFRGGWENVVKARMNYKVKQDFFSDKSSIEVGLGYTALNMESYLNIMNSVYDVGLEGKDLLNDEGKEALKDYGTYLLNMSTPTFGDWQQGHGYDHKTNYAKKLATLVKYVDDDALNWAAAVGTGGDAGKYTCPDYTSVVYNSGMKALLRNGWTKDAVALQTNADGGQKSHGQHDDLGVNFYAYGQHFLVDSLYHNYTANHEMNVLLNSTRGHNTIEINGNSQKGAQPVTNGKDPFGNTITNPGGGVLGSMHEENQELNKVYDFIQAETKGYQGNDYDGDGDFTETRDIFFLKSGMAVITDYIAPTNDKENTYVQNWHFIPNANVEIGKDNGLRTKMDGANLQLVPINQKNAYSAVEKTQGLYAVTAGNEIENPRYYLEKKGKGTTTFNTVLYPTKAGESTEVTTKNIETAIPENEASSFEINFASENGTRKGYFYSLTREAEKTGVRDFTEHQTDASLAYIEEQAGGNDIVIRNGSVIKDGDKVLLQSEKELKEFGFIWNDGKAEISSSVMSADDLKGIVVYAAEKPLSVSFEGTDVSFWYNENGLIHLGENGDNENPNPPVEEETAEAPTANVNSGEVKKGTNVTLSSATEDAKIYYTTDGSEPTTESKLYEEAITIDEDMTIKAIAVKEGMKASEVAEFVYNVKAELTPPTDGDDNDKPIPPTDGDDNDKPLPPTDGDNNKPLPPTDVDNNKPAPPTDNGTQTPPPTETEKPSTDENKKPSKVKVKKVSISASAKEVAAGKKVTLKATVSPKNATNAKVKWSTSNKKYATVSSKGVVTTKKAGQGKTVTITATATDGSKKKATVKIKIMKHSVKKVQITNAKKSLKVGKSMTLKAKVTTSGKYANKKVKWSVSNGKYASVNSNGKVTAKKAGKGKTVKVTAVSTDGTNKKATVKIKIKK